jgi:uncharacterized protein (TIGR02996 family)
MNELETCVSAWERGDLGARDAAAKALGIGLNDAIAQTVDALLQQANGERRKFRLSTKDVLSTVREAVTSPHGIAVRHGGSEAFTTTTLCFVVKPPGSSEVIVGIKEGKADRPSPGVIWPSLSPWQQNYARNLKRAHAWAAEQSEDRFAVTILDVPAPSEKKPDEPTPEHLLADVLARPEDNTVRLVYADWLMQRGDPRGELISVQCALPSATPAQRAELEKRERVLLRAHRLEWMRNAKQVATKCDIERGFVSTIEATPVAFANHGAVLFDHDPIETLILTKVSAKSLELLKDTPHLERLRRLVMDFYSIEKPRDVSALVEFFASKHLQRLRELKLGRMLGGEDVDASALFDGVSLPALEVLDAKGVSVPDALVGLPKARLPRLEVLRLPDREIKGRAEVEAAFPKAVARGLNA